MNHEREPCVLVVDDVVDNLLLMQFALESEGYTVELATNGRVALSKIRASPPALVLLDVMMPEMNGFELTQILRQSQDFSLLPIILVTADREVNLEQALAVGANGLVCKPIDMDELLIRIGHWFTDNP